MRNPFALLLILLIAPVALAPAASAATLHVPSQYAQIHAAVQAASAGDTVQVAAGTYSDCTHPTEGAGTTPACVIMKSGVTLIGAGPDATIIDAQGLGRGIFVEQLGDCRIENLQVTGAYAEIYGAGILIRNVNAGVEISDVRVTGCLDGGVVCIDFAHPVLSNLEIDHNEAKQGGGLAIEENSNPLVQDCVIHHNSAPSGAGIFIRTNCAPTLDNCTVTFNTITADFGNGGGIAVQNAAPMITNSWIANNSTLGYGGGVAFTSGASGTLQNSVIQANDAAGNYSLGGGVAVSQSDPVLTNLLIASNTCSGFYAEGGGIDVSFTPSPTITNCTLVENATGANGFGGGMSVQFSAAPTIERCIIANATVGQAIYCLSASPVVGCTNVWGNAGGDALCGTDNGGNFSLDPEFCGTAEKPFDLQPTSPCAAGNHPDGLCAGQGIGSQPVGCGGSPAPLPGLVGLELGNVPNPFNPKTTIWFEQPVSGKVSLAIYDLRGRVVGGKVWQQAPAGRTEYDWNGLDQAGRALPSGVYLYRVETNHVSSTRRMSLIR